MRDRHAYTEQNINKGKMVLTLRLWTIFFVVSHYIYQISATTHWVVTENGRIQAQVSFQPAVIVFRLETVDYVFLTEGVFCKSLKDFNGVSVEIGVV